jgi:alpha-galactosidase
MGFNTWNKFHCEINEGMVRDVAKAMVDTGMLAVRLEDFANRSSYEW